MEEWRARDRLEHILVSIAAIERLTSGLTLAEYSADPDRTAAVERYFERLSEASRHLPADWKERYPAIPWRQVADLGNVLRHAYDQIIDERIWNVIAKDLAPLRLAVVEMIAALHDDSRP